MNKNELDDLILRNLGLIKKVMHDLNCYVLYEKNEEEFENTYYAGLLELIQSARKYDPSVSTEGTYFYKCIRNGILTYFYLSSMPKRKKDKYKHLSIDEPINNSGTSITLADIIKNDDIDIEKEIERKVLIENVLDVLNQMKNKTDAQVIKMYYGLDGYKAMSYQAIANYYHCTRENISRRYKKAMKVIKTKFDEKENKNEIKKSYKKYKKKGNAKL